MLSTYHSSREKPYLVLLCRRTAAQHNCRSSSRGSKTQQNRNFQAYLVSRECKHLPDASTLTHVHILRMKKASTRSFQSRRPPFSIVHIMPPLTVGLLERIGSEIHPGQGCVFVLRVIHDTRCSFTCLVPGTNAACVPVARSSTVNMHTSCTRLSDSPEIRLHSRGNKRTARFTAVQSCPICMQQQSVRSKKV